MNKKNKLVIPGDLNYMEFELYLSNWLIRLLNEPKGPNGLMGQLADRLFNNLDSFGNALQIAIDTNKRKNNGNPDLLKFAIRFKFYKLSSIDLDTRQFRPLLFCYSMCGNTVQWKELKALLKSFNIVGLSGCSIDLL